jgi:hypothetical protein
VRPADEGDHDVAIGRLIQDDLRMTRRDDLTPLLTRSLCEHLVYLALSEDLKVGVRLVEKEDGPGIYRQVGKQQ